MTEPAELEITEGMSGQGNVDGGSDSGCVEGIRGLSYLYCPEAENDAHIRDVADVLVEMGHIGDEGLAQLRAVQEERTGC